MLNKNILRTEIQKFITENITTNISKLILKGSPFDSVSIQELANQIIAKQKSKYKLPTWFATENIYYPVKISIEQTSSEVTALYKSNLVSGNSILDITGGFGVDCYFFAKKFKTVTHCEINPELSEIVTHNYKQLKINNIITIQNDGITYLNETNKFFDCIYIDPSRRNNHKGKVFLLNDCLPNVPENLMLLFEKTNTILIKNSPMLDITSAINELKYVKEIHVIGVDNEVKELLFLLEKQYTKSVYIKTINLNKKKTENFNFIHKDLSETKYELPQNYLYEPNSSILKSGGFTHISKSFTINKLHQHSHLFTSEKLIQFPGRTFVIQNVIPYDKKLLKKLIPEGKANISTRNFPKTVVQIRKETKLKDGGNLYLFFTKNCNNKYIIIICTRINSNEVINN